MGKFIRRLVPIAILAALVLGCADATIRKVPNRADYENWSDSDQRRVDNMCGHRYYLSRPYVVVNRPFPVKSKTYFVDANVSDDGRRILIIGKASHRLAEDLNHVKHSGDVSLLAKQVWHAQRAAAPAASADGTEPSPGEASPAAEEVGPEARGEALGLPSAESDDLVPTPPVGSPDAIPVEPPAVPLPGDPNAAPAAPPAGAAADPMGGDTNAPAGGDGGGGGGSEQPAVPAAGDLANTSAGGGDGVTVPPPTDAPADVRVADSPTGTADLRIATDVKGIPIQDVNDYITIMHLPDFEEQYVIDPRANLGSLDLSLTQTPGGVLMALGMQVDNSVITRPIVDAYTDLLKAGVAAAKGAMGLPAAESDQLMVPGDESQRATGLSPGSKITLRVHVVSMATPGLYPILKASEVLDARNCLRSLSRCYKCRGERIPCSQCCDRADVESRVEQVDLAVPQFPFTRIAYSVHHTVIVEHLIPETKSLLNAGLTAFQEATDPGAESDDLNAADDAGEKLIAALDNLLATCGCVTYKVTAVDAATPEGTAELAELDALVFRFQRVVDGKPCSIHPVLRAKDAAAVKCCLLKSGSFKSTVRIQANAE